MKKLFFVAICMMSVSCSAEPERAQQVQPVKTKWQEAIDNATGVRPVSRSADKELRLLGYTYIGKLEDTQAISDVVDAMLADDAMIAIPLGADFSDFVVLPVGEVPHYFELPATAAECYADQKNRLKISIEPGMEVVSLHWSYGGREFSSTAIVADADRFFVYDNIASYIVTVTKTEKEEIVPASETRVSSPYQPCTRNFAKNYEHRSSVFGSLLCKIEISCTSTFNEEGILCNRSMNARHESDNGWTCDAQIRTLMGEPFVSRYHEFVWGYGCSPGSLNLEFCGVGFTISGGYGAAFGETGHEMHVPYNT